jgi:hypothetical protein
MAVWETDPGLGAQSELMADFAKMWRAADKVVYSTTLEGVATAKTRLERRFDADAIRAIKASVTGHLTLGGANLARQAFEAGLIDECRLFISPYASVEASPHCRATCASTSSWSTSSRSAAGLSTSGTAPRSDVTLSTRRPTRGSSLSGSQADHRRTARGSADRRGGAAAPRTPHRGVEALYTRTYVRCTAFRDGRTSSCRYI